MTIRFIYEFILDYSFRQKSSYDYWIILTDIFFNFYS